MHPIDGAPTWTEFIMVMKAGEAVCGLMHNLCTKVFTYVYEGYNRFCYLPHSPPQDLHDTIVARAADVERAVQELDSRQKGRLDMIEIRQV